MATSRRTATLLLLTSGVILGCSSAASPGGETPDTGDAGDATVDVGDSTSDTEDTGLDEDEGDTTPCEVGGWPVVTLACGQQPPNPLAVDATHVYWANGKRGSCFAGGPYKKDGSIMKVPIAGGAPIAIAIAQDQPPTALALHGTNVYWVNSDCLGNGTVNMASVDGGEARILASGPTLDLLAVDATGVYWGAPGSAQNLLEKLIKTPHGGTSFELGRADSPMGIALDATSVYWTEGWPRDHTFSYVRKMPLGGGTESTIFSGAAGAWNIATDGSNVYWILNDAVMSVPVGGGTPRAIACDPDGIGNSPIAVDATSVYWTRSADGALMRTPLRSDNSIVVAPAEGADHIVVDETNVYWAARGAVKKTAKLPLGAAGDASAGNAGASCYPP
jgi:hypothetical protein